jgi:hypothetical protein
MLLTSLISAKLILLRHLSIAIVLLASMVPAFAATNSGNSNNKVDNICVVGAGVKHGFSIRSSTALLLVAECGRKPPPR